MGSNPEFDLAIQNRPDLEAFLKQRIDEGVSFEAASATLLEMCAKIDKTEAAIKQNTRPPRAGGVAGSGRTDERVKASWRKRYVFRLETLLRLRQQREDEQKRVVASRLRKIKTIEQQKEVLQVRIAEQVDSMRALLTGGETDMDQVKAGRHWMVRLRRGVLEADGAITTNRTILAQERADLANARKGTKILEPSGRRSRGSRFSRRSSGRIGSNPTT